ncbi:alkaline phosphatase family protein [Acetobacterium carbinolicum]|uniref:alkaline phosphatase family protein n=1 Tax=Acetobacterium carbinolicum TaxID=52690 RepID=UPI0039C9883B
MKTHVRKIQIIAFLILLMVILSGCDYQGLGGEYPESFRISGDVETPLTVNTMMGYPIMRVTRDENNYTAIALKQVIDEAVSRSKSYDLLLIGEDGLSSKISGADLSGCHLSYSSRYDWELINTLHPISSQIKNLSTIIVISTDLADDKQAIGIDDQQGYRQTSAGNLFLEGFTEKRIFEGQSELKGRTVTVYTTHKQILPEQLLNYQTEFAVFGRDGSIKFDKKSDKNYFEISETTISFTASDLTTIDDVAGVLADPPRVSITDVASDTIHQLDKGNNVMVIELDGLSWTMLKTAGEQGKAPYLASLTAQQALSVYPPISPVGLAAMITGTLPSSNGIKDREVMDFNGTDIFERALTLGKTVAYIEGDIKMLNTSIEPVLSVNEGDQDSQVFKNSQKAITEKNQLIFTHFHSIDDDATTYGPYSQEAIEQIFEVDRMVLKLTREFKGTVIITADHGLHPTSSGGSHGRICYEDMQVPYIVIKTEPVS